METGDSKVTHILEAGKEIETRKITNGNFREKKQSDIKNVMDELNSILEITGKLLIFETKTQKLSNLKKREKNRIKNNKWGLGNSEGYTKGLTECLDPNNRRKENEAP